jgi:hypothetical protein
MIPGIATPTRTPFAFTIPDPTKPNTLDQQLARWVQQNWVMVLGAIMIAVSILDEFTKSATKAVNSTFVVATKKMLDKDGGVLIVSRKLQGCEAIEYAKTHGKEIEDDDGDEESGDPGFQGPPFTASSPPVDYKQKKFEDSPPTRYPGFGRDWNE